LANVFHGTDVNLGIFYSKEHVVVVFPSLGLARAGYLVPVERRFSNQRGRGRTTELSDSHALVHGQLHPPSCISSLR
jgi:hypothetical protein